VCLHPFSGSSKMRTKELDRFHGSLNSRIPMDQQKTARFIISTSSAIATGLTLAEAITVTFWEVDFNSHTMKQGFCRHVRQGNKNQECYCYLLVAEGNATEEKILAQNQLKERIQATTQRTMKEVVEEQVKGSNKN
jgi:hypothetical protein